MAYVYRHIRHDKNQPFYIGIGSDSNYKRAYQKSKTKRSTHWHNIAKNGYDVEIMIEGISWEEACEKEKEFIKLYGRSDLNTGILCNHTSGGDGANNLSKDVIETIRKKLTGITQSEYTKNKRKESLIKAWSNPHLRQLKSIQTKSIMSEDIRKKISKSLSGKKKKPISEQHKKKCIDALNKYRNKNGVHNKIQFDIQKENLIYNMYAEKIPIMHIAKKLLVSRSVIYRILKLKYKI